MIQGLLSLFFIFCAGLKAESGIQVVFQNDIEKMEKAFQPIANDLQNLLTRARHPKAPGVEGGAPKSSELKILENKIIFLNQIIQKILKRPSWANQNLSNIQDVAPIAVKEFVLTGYYTPVLRDLLVLKILMNQNRKSKELKKFGLELSVDDFESIELQSSPEGQTQIGPEWNIQLNGKNVFITPSNDFVLAMEIFASQSKDSKTAIQEMAKFFTIQQLMYNYSYLKYVSPKNANLEESWSHLQFQNWQGVSNLKDFYQKIEKNSFYYVLGYEMSNQIQCFFEDQKTFLTSKESQELLSFLKYPQSDWKNEDAERTLEENLSYFYQDELKKVFLSSQKISWLMTLSAQERLQTLKRWISRAWVNSVTVILSDWSGDKIESPSLALQQKVSLFLEEKKNRFLRNLSDSAVDQCWTTNYKNSEKKLFKLPRWDFIRSLLASTYRLNHLSLTKPIQPYILSQVLAEDFKTLEMTQTLQKWLMDIVSQPDYLKSRERFFEIIKSYLGEDVFKEGLYLSQVQARKKIREKDFQNPIHLENKNLEKLLLTQSTQSLQGDLRSLLRAGRWMGFTRIYQPGLLPSVEAVLTKPQMQKKYFQELKKNIRSENPILAHDLDSGTLEDFLNKKFKESKKLKSMEKSNLFGLERFALDGSALPVSSWKKRSLTLLPADFDSELVVSVAPKIDFALKNTSEEIQRSLEKTLEAESLEDLQGVLESSIIRQQMLGAAPGLSLEYENAVETGRKQSLKSRWISKALWVSSYPSFFVLGVSFAKTGFKFLAGQIQWEVQTLLKMRQWLHSLKYFGGFYQKVQNGFFGPIYSGFYGAYSGLAPYNTVLLNLTTFAIPMQTWLVRFPEIRQSSKTIGFQENLLNSNFTGSSRDSFYLKSTPIGQAPSFETLQWAYSKERNSWYFSAFIDLLFYRPIAQYGFQSLAYRGRLQEVSKVVGRKYSDVYQDLQAIHITDYIKKLSELPKHERLSPYSFLEIKKAELRMHSLSADLIYKYRNLQNYFPHGILGRPDMEGFFGMGDEISTHKLLLNSPGASK